MASQEVQELLGVSCLPWLPARSSLPDLVGNPGGWVQTGSFLALLPDDGCDRLAGSEQRNLSPVRGGLAAWRPTCRYGGGYGRSFGPRSMRGSCGLETSCPRPRSMLTTTRHHAGLSEERSRC